MKNSNDIGFSYCNVVGQTDVGKKRKANEDHGGHFETINGLVSVVCDGMGGHVGGTVASDIAVKTIHEFLDSQFIEDPREAIGLAIEAANNAIIRHAEQNPELEGMGSTCVLLIVRDGKVYIGHVGDSRIYLIREKTIIQLTKDHSFVQVLVDLGQITKEQAASHPRKNEITNALGLPGMTPATVREEAIDPQAGDCFLLCSDGLSGMVGDREIEKIVSRQRDYSSQQRADLLVQAANNNGGLDNITVELVEFTVSPDVPHAGSPTTSRGKHLLKIVLPAVCTLIAICLAIFLLKPGKHGFVRTVLPDIERSSVIQITRVPQADSYQLRLLPQAVDYTIDDKIILGEIETNMAFRDINDGIELFVDEAFVSDSAYIFVHGEKSDYRYDVRVNPGTSLETIVLSEVTFKRLAKIGTIFRDNHSAKISLEGTDTMESIEDLQSDIVVTPSSVVSQTNDYKILLQFPMDFTEDEIVLSFKTAKGDCKYVIPVSRSESGIRRDFLKDLVREETDGTKFPDMGMRPSDGRRVDSNIVKPGVLPDSVRTISHVELVPIEDGPALVISKGVTYKTTLGMHTLPMSEVLENGVSVSDHRLKVVHENGEYIINVADPKSGESFIVTILGKDRDGGKVRILFTIKYE